MRSMSADMRKNFISRGSILALVILICNLSGCGTFLSVEETTPDARQPDGIAVNKQANYTVQITLKNGTPLGSELLGGIDENKMLSINATRMPFASGTLQITVTKEQLVSEVGITSETGAVRAVQAADTIVKTKDDLKKK